MHVGDRIKWKIEYDYTYYKVYDDADALCGYFFPEYGEIVPEEREDEIIEKMTKDHERVHEGTLLVPMVKLDLLDHEEGTDIDYVIASLDANLVRVRFWKDWLARNSKDFAIFGSSVYTAREDRNMLSVAVGVKGVITLGEKQVKEFLTPLLDRMHQDKLL